MIKNRNGKKAKLLRELEEHPLVERACKKAGISKATYYRWLNKDTLFRRDVEGAQEKGRAKFNDFAESKLLENVNANIHQAIVYWLRHNSKRYRPHAIRVYLEENTQQKEEISKLNSLLNELVQHIGVDEALRIAGQDPAVFRAKVRKELEDQRKRLDRL
jgi:molybdenum-dependent DNA-binding transcriptional regulator ModE